MASAAAPREVGLLRLAAQRLAGPPCETVADATHWMTATQAQDLAGAVSSLALRTTARSLGDVRQALSRGEIVRSWPMRGTLHITAARDLGWMLAVTAGRTLASFRRRHAELGIDEAVVERAREVAVTTLEGGGRRDRAGMLAAWEAAGIATAQQRGAHLIGVLAQTGTLCWGPMEGAAQQLVLLGEWVPSPRRVDRDEAVAEWLERYLRSHGPTTVADFAWWTKVRVIEARAALESVRGRLERHVVDGVEMFMDGDTPDRLADARRRARGLHLLPGFDEYLLGYGNRGPVLSAEHAQRVCPGGNGVFLPTVVAAGQVIGTWKRRARGAAGPVEATPFRAFSPSVETAIARASKALPA